MQYQNPILSSLRVLSLFFLPEGSLDEKSIYNIKLRTIYELDKEGLSPQFDSKIFVSRAVERRFDKTSISLKDALNRRWIQNSYHYLATEFIKLKTVSGLLEKLFENKKDELIKSRSTDSFIKESFCRKKNYDFDLVMKVKLEDFRRNRKG